jgi:hypothetical protein
MPVSGSRSSSDAASMAWLDRLLMGWSAALNIELLEGKDTTFNANSSRVRSASRDLGHGPFSDFQFQYTQVQYGGALLDSSTFRRSEPSAQQAAQPHHRHQPSLLVPVAHFHDHDLAQLVCGPVDRERRISPHLPPPGFAVSFDAKLLLRKRSGRCRKWSTSLP